MDKIDSVDIMCLAFSFFLVTISVAIIYKVWFVATPILGG